MNTLIKRNDGEIDIKTLFYMECVQHSVYIWNTLKDKNRQSRLRKRLKFDTNDFKILN